MRHLRAYPRSLSLLVTTLALCSHAHAQSSVNISGYMDVGVFKDSAGTVQSGTIQRSNLAFSGTEDLGAGDAVTFRLSTRFELGSGSYEGAPTSGKPYFHDESTVGFKSADFGSLRIGRALDAMYAVDWQFDPWFYFDRVASPGWDLWHYNFPSDPFANSGKADYGRLNNGIFYDSPVIRGFQLRISTAPGSKAAQETNRPLGASVVYQDDTWQAMVAREKNSVGDTDTEFGLKATLGALSLMGVHEVSRSQGSKAMAQSLGASYTVGIDTYKVGWGQVDVQGVKAEQVVSAGYAYALSKRTTFYADLARKKYVHYAATVWGLGMSHSF
jgi:predicted porin